MDTSERAAFEKWADANQFCIYRDDSDKYCDYHRATTRFAWEAWQARAVLAETQRSSNGSEPNEQGSSSPAAPAQAEPLREDTPKYDPWATLGRFFKFWVGSALYDGSGAEVDLEEPYEAFRLLERASTLRLAPTQVAAQVEPLTKWSDERVQKVYDILCSDETPPPEQHWEGWTARRIVDALASTQSAHETSAPKCCAPLGDGEEREAAYCDIEAGHEGPPCKSRCHFAGAHETAALTDEQIDSKILDALSTLGARDAWDALTFESGPYSINRVRYWATSLVRAILRTSSEGRKPGEPE